MQITSYTLCFSVLAACKYCNCAVKLFAYMDIFTNYIIKIQLFI